MIKYMQEDCFHHFPSFPLVHQDLKKSRRRVSSMLYAYCIEMCLACSNIPPHNIGSPVACLAAEESNLKMTSCAEEIFHEFIFQKF